MRELSQMIRNIEVKNGFQSLLLTINNLFGYMTRFWTIFNGIHDHDPCALCAHVPCGDGVPWSNGHRQYSPYSHQHGTSQSVVGHREDADDSFHWCASRLASRCAQTWCRGMSHGHHSHTCSGLGDGGACHVHIRDQVRLLPKQPRIRGQRREK